MMPESSWTASADMQLWTDACMDGYGAYYDGHWIAERWSTAVLDTARRAERLSIPYLELYAVVTAAATWGTGWRGKQILFHCDSETAVHAAADISRDDSMMELLRCLHLLAALHSFSFRLEHISGVNNRLADLLSRAQLDRFKSAAPKADPNRTEPVPLPSISIDLMQSISSRR
jgi:hypothetical protein